MSEDIKTEQVSEETTTEVTEVTPQFTPEQMQKRIDDLTKENEKYRKSKAEMIAAEKKAKEQALAEQGKYKELYESALRDAEAAKKEKSNVEKRTALRMALKDMGAKHPELLENLFKNGNDWSFDLDENGNISKELLSQVKENYKSLFTEVTLKGDGAPQVATQQTKDLDTKILEAIQRGDLQESIRLKNSQFFPNGN